jgi:predicted TIM-barrel fold metal-dependent hydrolase
MAKTIDFHVHPFPNWSESLINRAPVLKLLAGFFETRVEPWRKQIRKLGWPAAMLAHRVQPYLRFWPAAIRNSLDELGGVVPLPGLLFERSEQDLLEAMDEAQMDFAVIIAHPPMIPNEFILELGQKNSRFLPAVNIPPGTRSPGKTLQRFLKKGARALKIHLAADGEGTDSARYHALLKVANSAGLPVILHTGCLHSHAIYRSPELSKVEHFVPWFKNYSSIPFVLAHMNFHEPEAAISVAEDFPKLWLDTSWQPPEVVGEAVRRLGSERILFGSDWPYIGHNIAVGKQRLQDGLQSGFLQQKDLENILGNNAARLLGIE